MKKIFTGFSPHTSPHNKDFFFKLLFLFNIVLLGSGYTPLAQRLRITGFASNR